MKNFPHQINDLGKLSAALRVARTIIAASGPYDDDGVFGSELAKAGVYNFRDKTRTVDQNLAIEAQKPLGDQGFRAAARDLRRILSLAGLIGPGPALSPLASDILGTTNPALRRALWREAMLQLGLPDAQGNLSHPYRILLRLAADHPGIETSKLMLALEARDDSPAEYARIIALADQSFDQIIADLGVSTPSARNAVKILPAIAEQVGDIRRTQGRTWLADAIAATEDSLTAETNEESYEQTGPVMPDAVLPENIAPIPNFGNIAGANVDLSAAIAILRRRTLEHQALVVHIAQRLGQSGYQTYANPYDCLGYKAGHGGILIEVKTLDGSRADERRQAEKALGQLKGYRHFSIPGALKMPKLVEVAAFSAQPSASASFLADNDIHTAWRDGNHWVVVKPDGTEAAFSPDALLA